MTSPDVTWNFAPTATWSAVESHLAVVSACLPCLRPIVNYIFTGSFETSRASSPVSSGGPNFSKEDSKTWGAGLFRCKSRGGKGTNYVANDLESLRSEPIGTEPGSRESKAHFGSEICEEVTEKMELERTDHSSIKGLKIYADLVEELRHDLSI